MEVWVFVKGCAIAGPMFPVFFPVLGILIHDAMANGFPRRQDITREHSFSPKWHSFQEASCGSGKSD